MARKTAEQRRTQLVEAGLTVIAREGMHAATVRAIVAEADVPLATFHYVFASRDEMIGEACRYVPDILELDPATVVPEGVDVGAATHALLTSWFERIVEQPQYELAIMEVLAYCTRTPALAHLPGEVQERYLQIVEGLIAAIEQRVGRATSMPPRELAQVVVHLTDGLTYAWLRSRDTAASRRMIDLVAPRIADAFEGRA